MLKEDLDDPELGIENLIRGKGLKWEDLWEDGKDFRECFGSTEENGRVVFFDAYPVLEEDRNLMELDILNPHYSEYYTGKGTPPADYLSPKPTQFLTVARGTSFLFRLYTAHKGAKIIPKAKHWLIEALTGQGIGSKTSLNYGIFECSSEKED